MNQQLLKSPVLFWTVVVAISTAMVFSLATLDALARGSAPRQVSADDAPSPEAEAAVAANNAFAFDLYAELAEEPGNVFFSPYSISLGLGILYAGACGYTEVQIAGVFHFDGPKETLHEGFYDLSASLSDIDIQSSKGDAPMKEKETLELLVANRGWAQEDHDFLEDYIDVLDTYYQARMASVDFAQAPEDAAGQINEWVQEQTEGKITEIIGDEQLGPDTRLVLTNATYFKGTWLTQFDPESTLDLPFHLADGTMVMTPMMTTEGDFRYLWHDDFRMLDMPYVGDRLAMLVILPHVIGEDEPFYYRKALDQIEALLTPENLDQWLSDLVAEPWEICVPKFTIETVYEMKDVLSAMGMPAVFELGEADLSGMDGTRDLFLGDALHSAFVDVNEEGTEAAAASSFSIVCSGTPTFRIDHPFIFLIRDALTGAILFMGRIEDPTA